MVAQGASPSPSQHSNLPSKRPRTPSVCGDKYVQAVDSPDRRHPHRPMPARSAYPPIAGCSYIDDYERLNHIEEGSYGVVFRARHKPTGDIVALKKLKLDRERNGFPITSLREIRTLMMAKHDNVVRVREVVVGHTLTQIFIVFEFVEHDLRTLLKTLEKSFLLSEIKSLVLQVLRAVSRMHLQWIVHRDLKTSNLLLNNRGVLKVADFGLARLYGEFSQSSSIQGSSQQGQMTNLVVTLWYRAPELLLGANRYDGAVDMWSVGCILAEMVLQKPLFMGRNEADQLGQICRKCGPPSKTTWPQLAQMPRYREMRASLYVGKYRSHGDEASCPLQSSFPQSVATEAFMDLLTRLLRYNPASRITADEALTHPWFHESPRPAHPDSFGSFPSVAAGESRKRYEDRPDERSPPKPAPRRERPEATSSTSSSASAYHMQWGF